MWQCVCGQSHSDEKNFCTYCGKPKINSFQEEGPWYYIDAGQRIGPVSSNDIRMAISQHEITKQTLVWRKGFSDWLPAHQTSLHTFFKTVVPRISPKAIHDKWVWCLATIPLTVNLLLFQLLDGEGDFLITIILFALNSFFLRKDSKYLSSIGYDMGKVIFLGFLFIPIYLIVRPIKTNKNFLPAIFWSIFFFLSLLPIW